MPARHRQVVYLLEYLVPWLVLPILLLYTYLELAHAPYIGFGFSPSTGHIQEIFVVPPDNALQAGDVILRVGDIAWDAEQVVLHNTLLNDVAPGEVLPLQIARNGQEVAIAWRVPGVNAAEFRSRLFNAWILGYVFWLAGTATTLLIRPRDTRTRLFTAFFLLTAVWLVAGNTSRWNSWEATSVFRVAIWLAVPVYLHLHWCFPQSLAALPSAFWRAVYGVVLVIAVCQWFEIVPRNAYALAFAVALVGSAVLLLVHYFRQPAERNRVRVLAFGFLFAIIPLAGLAVVRALGQVPPVALLALGALPVIPAVYFYTIYRYRLGGLEFRANQLLALYLFVILLGSTWSVLVALINLLPDWPSKDLLAGVLMSLLAALLGIYAFPPFQRLIETRLLGIKLPSARLLDTFAAHITTSLTQRDLARLLQADILPALLIRQSALLLVEQGQLTPIYLAGLDPAALPGHEDVVCAMARSSLYLSAPPDTSMPSQNPLHHYVWLRVGIPIRFEERLIGVWLLGRRDPDDGYTLTDLSMLQTLAHQTAIALINIEQAQQLQALYEANIDRHELERTQLAHVLHDDILGGLSLLKASLDSSCLTDRFEHSYQGVKQRVMHMITGLRPAMLNYGLHAALEELTDDLRERTDSMVVLQLDGAQLAVQLPAKVEEHLFRIVQQACENALRHSQADTIRLAGSITDEGIDLAVVDNGIGFDTVDGLSIAQLLAHKHFGLVGMYERAKSIDATLAIESVPSQGSSVRVIWPSTALPAGT